MEPANATKRRREITAAIAHLGFCLPGSFVENYRRCSTLGCHCHDDPANLHGPYRLWTRKVAGKTVSQTLNQTQYERYRPWIDNARKLHELIAELERLSGEVMAETEGFVIGPAPPPDRRRSRPLDPVGNRRAKAGK